MHKLYLLPVFLIILGLGAGCDEDTLPVEVPDTTPPTVIILQPGNNANLSGEIEITVSATDDDSGVAQVDLMIDGNAAAGTTLSTLSYTWDTSTLVDGSQHTLHATATDNAGNTGQSAMVTVFINVPDTEAPTVMITAPGEDEVVADVVTITATATDNIGVNSVTFFVDDNPVSVDTTAPWEYAWDTSGLPANSPHLIKAEAIDGAGNSTQSPVVTVTIGEAVSQTRLVVSEMFTGTWCHPCNEFADPAMDSLYRFFGPDEFISIQYHFGADPWYISGTDQRISYYGGIGTFPTALFDGQNMIVGACDFGAILEDYEEAINNALAAAPKVGFLQICGALADGSVTIKIKALADLSAADPKLRGTINENNLTHNDHVYRHVVRYHIPEQDLTAIVNQGDTAEVTVSFTLDGTWNISELELVLFVQDDNSNEILQGFVIFN